MFNKSFTNMRRDLSSGQGIGVSIFSGNSVTKNDVQHIRDFDTAMKNGSTTAQAWQKHMTGCTVAAKQQAKQCLTNKGSLTELANGLQQTTVKAKGAELGLKALSIAGNMLMMMGISMAISGIIKGFQALANAQENAIEKANEFINKFEEQRDKLTSNKQAIDSMSSDYEKLAKGVDSLGRNVSLNSAEYARYNEIVNQIADMFPHMVQGYTDEGNAIIKCKGDVEKLTQAYKDQKDAAQDAIIVGSAEVFAGFKASTDKTPKYIWEESGLLQMKELVDKIVATGGDVEKIQEVINDLGGNSLVIGDVFDKIGLDKGWFDWNTQDAEYISENIKKFQSLFNTLNTEVEAQAAKIKPIMQAYLEQSEKFQLADDKVQDMVKQIVGQFDAEFYSQFDSEAQMASWVEENVIDKLRGNKDLVNDFSVMFDLQTKFNAGDITVTEYQEKLTAFLSLIDTLPDETQKAIKLLFGITTNDDGTTSSDVDTMVKNVKDKVKGKFNKEIGQLKLDELEILTNLDISPDGIKDWSEVEALIANASKEVNEMTVSLSEMEKASDKISKLGSAFKELSDDGYITTKTLGELQTATGLSGDEWAEYENRLLNAKKGSSDFNQVLSELTYKILENEFATIDLTNATDEEITAIENKIAATLRENGVENANAVAHEYVRMARVNAAIAAYDGTQASYDSAAALISESLSAEQAKVAMNQLELAKINVNNAKITSSDDIDNIIAIANAALASEQTLKDLALAKAQLADDFVGPVSKSTMDIMNGTYEFEFDKLDPSDFKVGVPRYTGGSYSGSGKDSGGSDDNAPEWQDPTEATINRINLRSKELKQEEEAIQSAIELAETEEDYEKQISLTNDLLAKRKQRIDELNKANAGLHNEAEYLRNSNPYDEESWFNSQGEATEKYISLISRVGKDEREKIESLFARIQKYKKAYAENAEEIVEINKEIAQGEKDILDIRLNNSKDWIEERNRLDDWHLFNDNEVKAWERVIKWLKEEYPHAVDEIKEAEESLFEARENNLNDVLDEIQRHADNVADYYDDINDELDKRITKEEALLQIKQKQTDITSTLLDTQSEIDKALRDSMISLQYLNEEERKLIFNEEDYTKLSKLIESTQDDINRKTAQFYNDVIEAYNQDKAYLIESITAEYERQVAMKERELEIAQAQVDLTKKQLQLNNVLAEKNVKQLVERNGQYIWEWVADTDKVRQATEELMDAEAELKRQEYEQKQQEAIDERQRVIDGIKAEQAANDYRVEKMNEYVDDLSKAIENCVDPIKSFEELAIQLGDAGGDIVNAFYNAINSISGMGVKIPPTSTSSSSSIGSGGGGGVSPYNASIATMKSNSAEYNITSSSYRQSQLHAENQKIGASLGLSYDSGSGKWKKPDGTNAYASGTRNTKSGSALMGEDNFEAFINKNGHLIPINQPTIGNIDSGGVVFNTEQMSNLRSLWDLSNLGRVNVDTSLVNRTISSGNGGTQNTFAGDIIINAPRDYNDFVRQLTQRVKAKSV